VKREPGGPRDEGGKTGTVSPQREAEVRTPERARPRRTRLGRQGIGRAAVMIGVITVLARLVGFGRQVVFAHTVGTTCLGTAYTTANMVPNIIYDIVMGGALTAVVVPVLAGPARARAADPEQAERTSAALLSWTVLLLVPVSAVVAIAARPLVSVLLGAAPGCPRSAMVALGTRMLIVFAPQILLYGLAVVLYGILQAHRKFAAPALAPVLSSLVVIGAYFWFARVADGAVNLRHPVSTQAWLILAVGTTAGVAALVATPLVPVTRLRLRLRPVLRFPAEVGARVRSLAVAGIVTLIVESEPAHSTQLFRYQYLRTLDPVERYDNMLEILQGSYFQDPTRFADLITALFGPLGAGVGHDGVEYPAHDDDDQVVDQRQCCRLAEVELA